MDAPDDDVCAGLSIEKIFLINKSQAPGCCCSRVKKAFLSSSSLGSTDPDDVECLCLVPIWDKIGDSISTYVFDDEFGETGDAVDAGKRFICSLLFVVCACNDCVLWWWLLAVNEDRGGGGMVGGIGGGLVLCLLSRFGWRSG